MKHSRHYALYALSQGCGDWSKDGLVAFVASHHRRTINVHFTHDHNLFHSVYISYSNNLWALYKKLWYNKSSYVRILVKNIEKLAKIINRMCKDNNFDIVSDSYVLCCRDI